MESVAGGGVSSRTYGGIMLEVTVERVVAFVAWLIANWAYLDFCRRGEGGFMRLVAFWIGFPTTFVTSLVVEEGGQPRMREDDDDLDELFREARRDRILREGPDGT